MSAPSAADLRARLDAVTIRDAERLRHQLDRLDAAAGARTRRSPAHQLAALERRISAAEDLAAARAGNVPAITYPDLPIAAKRDEIATAIADHQVVVIAGETGSGKTTQLPKICLDLGRGVRGLIGHTQPRRLAARTVAQRIADELQVPLGDAVGYTVRFTDQLSDRTLVRLMTDGILLAEIQRDPNLLRYDTLILDEAHERSLNIDFLLGYLRQLLPRRPDLSVIITSATIEPHRFAAHFNGAPVVEVSGRTYPVEVRYRPLEPEADDTAPARDSRHAGEQADRDFADDPEREVVHRVQARDQTEAIVDAVRELQRETPGDVLVFLSGEREIRDTAEALRAEPDLEDLEVLPLYARLPTAEQQRVFESHRRARVVLATNVAETSLTVPGIKYVIDPGTARISRYSRRTKVQRLPIEPISQASAAQRAGRCGRTSDGVAIRLYSRRDFDSRPPFTDPEILRTNLAAVILKMAALRLGAVEEFPFLDPPDRRSVRDGIALLHELGAFDAARITELGRRMARLPVDPRLARMIVQADVEGCVREVLVIVAALAIPDPRERPSDREPAARAQHARFADANSDFISYLNLWTYLREQRRELSGNQFRRVCREEFLHYLRIREWQDLVGQLRTMAADLGVTASDEPAPPERIHAALLAGLLSHVGVREGDSRDYLGARNARFALAPGSVLSRRTPRWVMVAELVETSRLYGRIAARIEPEAVQRLAEHLIQRSYSEPHWDGARGAAMAYERVTLYGLALITRRRVGLGNTDPELARELFIRHALVEGDWHTRHRFFAANQALRAELATIEDRVRRRDLLVDDEHIHAFYDARVPASVTSAQHFDTWWKRVRRETPQLLTLTRADLLRRDDPLAGDLPGDLLHGDLLHGDGSSAAPARWHVGDLELPVSYRFEPGTVDDGVTVHVPLDVLTRLGGDEFAWQVPALREELVTALIRSLPKDMRRHLVPAPDTARQVLAELEPGHEPLLPAVQRALQQLRGVLVPIDAFDVTKLAPHLRVTFAVEDTSGAELARGKDLSALQEQLAAPVRAAVAAAVAGDTERRGLRDWPDDLDELPRMVERSSGGYPVRGYPALTDAGDHVDVRMYPTAAEAHAAMRAGSRRLLRLAVPTPTKRVERTLTQQTRLVLGTNPDGSLAALLDDCADAAVDVLAPQPVWSRLQFEANRTALTESLVATTADIVARVERVLAAHHDVRVALPTRPPASQVDAVHDIDAQLRRLLPPGFVARTGRDRLPDLARYVSAIGRRLALLGRDVDVDRARMARVQVVQQAFDDLVAALPAARAEADDVRDIAALIEELRVSLWAQQLGTARPVSEQRIFRALDSIKP